MTTATTPGANGTPGRRKAGRKAALERAPERPRPLPPLPDNIPAELKQRAQWVNWSYKRKADLGKWDKPPLCPADGQPASATDPGTWGSLEQAVSYYRDRKLDGIGFVFTAQDEFLGIDLDDCRNPDTGEIEPWAMEIVQAINSYAEVSPSRTGVKIVCEASMPAGDNRFDALGVEMYAVGRYFTLTGHRLEGTPATVEARQQQVDRLHRELIERKGAGRPKWQPGPTWDAPSAALTNQQILDKLTAAKNGEKFRRLWSGDWGGYASQSEADLALCCLISFYTDDPAQVYELVRLSGLNRSKWDREDYARRTIGKAFELRTVRYDPEHNSRRVGPGPRAASGGGGATAPAGAAGPAASSAAGDSARNGVEIIVDYFREHYQPLFRRGNAIYCKGGDEVPMQVAVSVPTSQIIDRLTEAADAPRYANGGHVKRDGLPGFFSKWAKVAWGDLLTTLPDEDEAELGESEASREEFRRLVTEAMLSEIVLGDVIHHGGATQTERRSLIDWCYKFAKEGPWRAIRSKKCWCKLFVADDGEMHLKVAVRHELFAQVRADRRLSTMRQNTFTRRCEKYGVGRPDDRDRPCGVRAVILDQGFVDDLLAGLPDDPELATDTVE